MYGLKSVDNYLRVGYMPMEDIHLGEAHAVNKLMIKVIM